VSPAASRRGYLLTRLALDLDPNVPVLFLDTGYHFAETYEYRDRMAREWKMNLFNLLPEQTVAQQESQFASSTRRLRSVLQAAQGRSAVQGCANYRVWVTGFGASSQSRTALESRQCLRYLAARMCSSLRLSLRGPRATSGTAANNSVSHCCLSMNAATPQSAATMYMLPIDPNDPRSGVGQAGRSNVAYTSKRTRVSGPVTLVTRRI